MLDFFVDENLESLGSEVHSLYKLTQKDIQDTNKTNGKIAQIFSVIQANLNSDLVNKTGAIFQFNVRGKSACEIKYCLSLIALETCQLI